MTHKKSVDQTLDRKKMLAATYVLYDLDVILHNDWILPGEAEAHVIELFVKIKRIVDEYKQEHGRKS
jgi:hypothetical protein